MSRLNPREALEVSPFDTGVFSWKMRTRAIQENHWLQIDDGRKEDLLEKKKGPQILFLFTKKQMVGKSSVLMNINLKNLKKMRKV